MTTHDRSALPDQDDAGVCRSAAALLRSAPPPGRADNELARRLDGLLSAVSAELEADGDSVPAAVRRAAVQLAAHVVLRAATPNSPCRVVVDPAAAHRAVGTDHAKKIPFNRSLRLGRMG